MLVLALLAAAQETAPPKCAISGTVVDSVTGQPLNQVDIEVDGVAGPTPFTTSDAKGGFTLIGLPSGQYRLKGNRNGYLETYYGARAGSKGTPIRLDPGQRLDSLQFKLRPFAVIAGTVRDQDGEPLARAQITLHRLQFDNGRRRVERLSGFFVRTDDQGQYRVAGLPPGRYYLRAEPDHMASMSGENHSPKSDRPLETLLPALYPGVADPGAARPVEIAAGARVTGIDITLPRSATQRVTVHVRIGAGATLGYICLGYSGTATGDAGFEYVAQPESNGLFEFPAIPPGSYTLTASARPPIQPSADPWETIFSQHEYAVHVPLQVGDVPVENVELAVPPPGEIDGRITIEGDSSVKLSGANLTFDDGADDPVRVTVHDHLRFKTGLGPGRYNLDLQAGNGYVLRRIQIEGKNVTGEGLTVSGGEKIPLEIVVGKDAGEIEGSVADNDGKSVAGATVVLVPEPGLRTHPSLFRCVETDQAGRFDMNAGPPGIYKLFAWDDVEPGIWWDPEFLKNHEGSGHDMTLKPGGHESAALKLIEVPNQ